MNYVVTFIYSNNDNAAYLFKKENEAKKCLFETYEQQLKYIQEEDLIAENEISEDGWYAKIVVPFPDEDEVTEMRIIRIYE